ncbi:ABC transporter substrate-binding protein [beta proteobacterium AAP121]|nr:ABC transporter substrate-binding protein [beta proteobacterium AAP65]KPF96780.1 ABC transporter substrate-binding protein [beta proteobacterium AAP121]
MKHGFWRLFSATLLGVLGGWPAAQAATVVDDRGRTVVLPAAPQRVVSLLPSLTEAVCALQACNRLVGTDRFSNWPASVLALPKLGGLDDTQIERLVALKPDLVLAAGSSRAIDRLEALGLAVVALEPKTLQDTERVLGKVGQALGDAAAGAALWQRLQQRMAAAAARVPAGLRGQKVYFEVASAPYAAGESSFVGELLTSLGMGNVVPAAMGPFPKLNPEFVVRAQPDIVIGTARAVAEMPARPGWGSLRALHAGRHCGFASEPWDTLVRPGPRLAEGAELLADCLAGLAGRTPAPVPAGAAAR